MTLPTPFYLLLRSYLSKRHFYVRINNENSNLCEIQAGIPQGSVLGPILYTLYTSDMPLSDNVTIATYADDTALISNDICPTKASKFVQDHLDSIAIWLNKWNICVNPDKSSHITFTLRKEDCPSIFLNGEQIPRSNCIKYLGMHLDRRLTWKEHIKAKREQLNIKTKRMYWVLGLNSQLNLENKVMLYKAILKPIWTYGIQLWGTASNSNIEILQRYQSKTLRMITKAPWYITNDCIHRDLRIPKVKLEISRFSKRYVDRLSDHINDLAIALLDDSDEIVRLKRFHTLDLPFRK